MNKIIAYSLLALTMTAGNLYAQIAAKIIGIQGRAEYKRPGNAPWLPAVNFQNLENGDSIRTLAQSRAVVLLADETQVKLNANTTLELQNVRQTSSLLVRVVQASVAQTGQSLLNLSQGQTWLRSKLKPANVRVNTPAVTAAIRGTEFDIQVAGDGETVLSMMEGSVDFANPQGAIIVNAGEQGRVRIGQAPTKIVLVRPRDAVQWILAYSGAVSAADYQYLNQAQAQLQSSLASALARRGSAPQDVTNLLTLAHVQHDLGQKKDAEETLQAALRVAPSNNEALIDLAWLYLETNRANEAIPLLQKVPSDGARSTVALALAHYRQGDIEQFYSTIRRADASRSSLAATQRAFAELLYGNASEARRLLETVPSGDPNYATAQALLSNVLLVQNEKNEAIAAAQRAVSSSPRSPSAYLSLSAAQQSFFQIPEALESAQKALALDPDFVQAQVQVAKLSFATGDTAKAEQIARQGLGINSSEAGLNSLLGYILLAQAKTEESKTYFNRSIAQDPTRGEPHLGLAIAAMRQGKTEEATQSILIATTLEPQIAAYHSYLGKAFFDQRRFEMAFDTLGYASSLDENDPTPYLYSGVFLNDLSRPGEAVKAFTKSIRLNNNRAVYRSRFLLDEDRATRNINLATAYNRMYFSEWGNFEALRSQIADPTNSSTHIFLAQTFLNLRGRTQAAGSEQLLARLLLPVNANSFNSFNDYTTLFEMPRVDTTTEGRFSSFNGRLGTVINTGGSSKFAYGIIGSHSTTDGFRPKNDDVKSYDAIAQFKFALTPHSDLMVLYSHDQDNSGDRATGVIDFKNDPNRRVYTRRNRMEIGYHRQFRPGSDALVYFSAQKLEQVLDNPDQFLIGGFTRGLRASSRDPDLDLQATHLHKTGPFQFRYGLDIFEGRNRVRRTNYGSFPGSGTFEVEQALERQLVRYKNAYVYTDYAIHPKLMLTGAMHYDWANDNNFSDLSRRAISKWNPQAGVFYSPIDSTTLRFAFIRSLQTHFRERLAPTNVHGFVIQQNDLQLAQSTSYNFGWDQRLFSGSFIRGSAFYRDRRTPVLEQGFTGFTPTTVKNHFHGGSIVLNQLLTEQWSFSPEYNVIRNEEVSGVRHEHELRLRMFYISPKRIWLNLNENFIRQGGTLSGKKMLTSFFTTDLNVSYELPRKYGLVTFGVANLFDRQFALLVDPLALDPRIPKRYWTLSLRFNY